MFAKPHIQILMFNKYKHLISIMKNAFIQLLTKGVKIWNLQSTSENVICACNDYEQPLKGQFQW